MITISEKEYAAAWKASADEKWDLKCRRLAEEFATHAHGLLAAAVRLEEHDKKRPKDGISFLNTSEFRDAVDAVGRVVKRLEPYNDGWRWKTPKSGPIVD
jgi:hypothetical protein